MPTIDLGSTGLRASLEGGVLRVVIDRPERRNSCTIEMYHGIKKAAVVAEKDPAIDMVVLTGSGEHFCVGGEMGGKHEGGQPLDRETDGLDLTPFVQLERCPKLVLVAINGVCMGGGLVMTLMSDLSVASSRATFRVPELLRGVADCYLGARLASRVGIARAKWLLFTAQTISADEALAMGLISRVVPHEQLEAAVEETIGWVRQTAPRARTLLKRDLNRALPPIDMGMFAESLSGEEVREGFTAFVQKRPASWVK
ncbi:MAG TPA: enoyl-CoA hydratase/isomerase family protein [Candidatus Binatia bacterium]|jgi:enoyl-CoA hydratase/carnithine racemase|nr:enoyl-CoA hydratase/isomerase family protein [Candidatus Binatia bacterium]